MRLTCGSSVSTAPNSSTTMLPPPSRCRRPSVPRPPIEAREGLHGETVHLHGATSGISGRARHRIAGAAARVSCAWYITPNLRHHSGLGVDSDAAAHSYRAATARRSQSPMVRKASVTRRVGVAVHTIAGGVRRPGSAVRRMKWRHQLANCGSTTNGVHVLPGDLARADMVRPHTAAGEHRIHAATRVDHRAPA